MKSTIINSNKNTYLNNSKNKINLKKEKIIQALKAAKDSLSTLFSENSTNEKKQNIRNLIQEVKQSSSEECLNKIENKIEKYLDKPRRVSWFFPSLRSTNSGVTYRNSMNLSVSVLNIQDGIEKELYRNYHMEQGACTRSCFPSKQIQKINQPLHIKYWQEDGRSLDQLKNLLENAIKEEKNFDVNEVKDAGFTGKGLSGEYFYTVEKDNNPFYDSDLENQLKNNNSFHNSDLENQLKNNNSFHNSDLENQLKNNNSFHNSDLENQLKNNYYLIAWLTTNQIEQRSRDGKNWV